MKENIYDQKSSSSLIFYFSIPAIFSLIVEIMASVVDTAFAGHLKEISVDATAFIFFRSDRNGWNIG